MKDRIEGLFKDAELLVIDDLFLRKLPSKAGDELADVLMSRGHLLKFEGKNLDRLTDRYRVLVIDPPGQGKSAPLSAADFTADRLCHDFLSVADAAGFDRFTWCGYSWGGVMGIRCRPLCDAV